jgi:hypothetical protein
LAKALEVPLVNDLGYTKRYVRCLQVMFHSYDIAYGIILIFSLHTIIILISSLHINEKIDIYFLLMFRTSFGLCGTRVLFWRHHNSYLKIEMLIWEISEQITPLILACFEREILARFSIS